MAEQATELSRIKSRAANKPKSNLQSILTGSIFAFLFRIGGAGFTFLVNIVIARKFGAEGNGAYYIALTITTIASMIGKLGMDTSMLRFVAAGSAQGQWGKVKNVYRKGMLLSLGLSTALTVLLLLLAPFIAGDLFKDPSAAKPLMVMSLSVIPLSLLNITSESLKGLNKTFSALFVQSLGAPLIFIVLLVLPSSDNLMEVFVYYSISQALMMVMGQYYWTKETRQYKASTDEFSTKFLIQESIPLFWVTSLNTILSFADTIMLGIWKDSATVGIYGAALRITTMGSMLLFAVNSVVGPRFSALWQKEDRKGLEKLGQYTTLIMLGSAILFTLPFLLFPNFILGLFGEGFSKGTPSLMILALGQFIALATGPVAFLLMMTGNGRFHRNNVFISVLINVVLNVLLIPKFGMTGAAIATSFSLIVKNILGWIFVKKKLNLKLFYLF